MKAMASTLIVMLASSAAFATNGNLACESVNRTVQSRLTITREADKVVTVLYESQRPFSEEFHSLKFDTSNSKMTESATDEQYKLDILGDAKFDEHINSITSPKNGRFEITVQGTSPIDRTWNNGLVHFICEFQPSAQ